MINLPSQSTSDAKAPSHSPSKLANNTSSANTSNAASGSNTTNTNTATQATNNTQQSPNTTSSGEIKNLQQQLQQRQAVTAEVVSTQALSKQDQALLQKVQPSLFNQLSSQSSSTTNTNNNPIQGAAIKDGLTNNPLNTASGNSNSTKLASNQAITLYLIKIVSQQQSLTTLSSTRLLPGDKVQLQQNAQQQLQIQTVVGNTQLKSGIIDSYKQALPLQQTASQTLQVAQLLQQLPNTIKQQLLPAKLLAALETVTQFAQSDKTLQQPQQLQNAIKNSGLFLENKIYTATTEKSTHTLNNTSLGNSNTSSTNYSIATTANRQGSTSTQHNAIANDLRAALGKLQQQLSPEALANKTLEGKALTTTATNSTNHKTTSTTNNPTSELPTKKPIIHSNHELLNQKTGSSQKLEQFVQLLLSTLQQQTPASTQTQQPANLPTKELNNILQLLGIRVGVEQTPQKAATEFIGQQLKQLINGANEKNRLNQLRSLGIDTTSSTDTNTIKGINFTTELPLRWGEQVLPLHLSIREQVQEQYNEHSEDSNTEKENESARQWHIFLSFELPNNEQLHTQVSLIEHTLSATVWAESQQLCDKAQQQLGHLRKSLTDNGFKVEDIYCIQGKPPQQDTSLAYNLVDIKT